MARHRNHSIQFKRQIVQEYFSGESLHGLARRYDIARNLKSEPPIGRLALST